uniref:Uncharacterized protein n=1 Tax=Ditylenchus dipsaci TaxID=166011 RepID=A0A915E5H4_9BILA
MEALYFCYLAILIAVAHGAIIDGIAEKILERVCEYAFIKIDNVFFENEVRPVDCVLSNVSFFLLVPSDGKLPQKIMDMRLKLKEETLTHELIHYAQEYSLHAFYGFLQRRHEARCHCALWSDFDTWTHSYAQYDGPTMPDIFNFTLKIETSNCKESYSEVRTYFQLPKDSCQRKRLMTIMIMTPVYSFTRIDSFGGRQKVTTKAKTYTLIEGTEEGVKIPVHSCTFSVNLDLGEK